jgi:hypothetical protein
MGLGCTSNLNDKLTANNLKYIESLTIEVFHMNLILPFKNPFRLSHAFSFEAFPIQGYLG